VSSYQKTNDDLQKDIKGLVATVDREQKLRFEAEDRVKQLTEVLEEKKHSEQLAGWAIDRSLELIKNREEGSQLKSDVDTVLGMAEKFCDWIKSSSAQPKSQVTQETMN